MSLAILNVGAGDTKLTFDKDKPEERERAARIVGDMLRRGFAILVQVDVRDGEPLYRRAKAFDPLTCEYVIAGMPDDAADVTGPVDATPADVPAGRKTSRRGRLRRVPAEGTAAVAVARSARGCAGSEW